MTPSVEHEIALRVDGTTYQVRTDVRTTLLDLLREHLGLARDEEGLRSRAVRGMHRRRGR